MFHVRAVAAAFMQQWVSMSSNFRDLTWPIRHLPIALVFVWIATQSEDSAVATHVLIGVALMTTSNQAMFQMGWVLSSEVFEGTMQHTLISRTPLFLTVLGKTAAVAAFGLVSGVVALVAGVWVARELLGVANAALLTISLLASLLAIVSTGFIWSPLFLLIGNRPGFFNAILPFAVVFGGFIAPVDRLSAEGEAVARLLPTAWTSDAVFYSIRDGTEEAERIFASIAVGLALTAAYFALTYVLMGVVERRLRVTATLDVG